MNIKLQGSWFQQAQPVRTSDIKFNASFGGGIQKIRGGLSSKPAKLGIVGMALCLLAGIFTPKAKAFSLSSHSNMHIVEEVKQKNIAVVDCFQHKYIDVDGDNKPDLSHGRMLAKILATFLPGYNVDTYDVSSDNQNEYFSYDKLYTELDKIVKKIAEGVKYETVNISLSLFAPYKKLSDELKTTITPENIVNKQELIRKEFVTASGSVIQSIETIIKSGVPVYISSGNKAGHYDILNSARGAISVGALDKEGHKIEALANNSDVDRYIKSEINLTSILEEGKLKGFDLNNDGTVDIQPAELTGLGNTKPEKPITMYGSSIATLLAIYEDLKK